MKNKAIKIISSVILTLLLSFMCYVFYSHSINNLSEPWEIAVLSTLTIGVIFEFLIVWLIFGMDIIKSFNE